MNAKRHMAPGMLMVLAVGAAGAPPPATGPATAPATRPALLPIVAAGSVEQALRYTDEEKTILADVHDRDGTLSTPALYLLLRRAQMLPAGRGALTEADRPNPRNLWRRPADYRGRLVRLEGRYLGQDDWSAQATPTRWWGTRGVWLVYLVETETGDAGRIMVMLPRKPPVNLRVGHRLQVAGLFYKVVELPGRDDPSQKKRYPVIAAQALFRPGGGAGGAGIPPQALLMFALVVLLLVGFFLLRRRTSRRPARAGKEYTPLRHEDADDAEQEPEPVDPELIRQVREYQAEHPKDDSQSHADRQNHPG